MLFQTESDLLTRQAESQDREQLARLLQRSAYQHRHLGWRPPLFWLGSQPFYLLERGEGGILAALACPPDEGGAIWLRLFAVAPGYPVNKAWRQLWLPAQEWLNQRRPGGMAASLAIDSRLENLLQGAGFETISKVATLVWRVESAQWPPVREALGTREMTADDIPRVYQVDQQAFKPLWQNTPSQLEAALEEAFYAAVVLSGETISGYQISTLNPQGGHLARLAVLPSYQGQGMGIKLLDDLLDRCVEEGIVEVTVNTQTENHSSLALYRKFGFIRLDEEYPVLGWQIQGAG